MKWDLREIREWLSQDITQLVRWRSFSIAHLAGLHPMLQRAYYVTWTLSALIIFFAFIQLLPTFQTPNHSKAPLSSYTRHRMGQNTGEDRLALMQALALAGVESRDPAWMEFRAFADCVGVNARPDLENPLVIWRWNNSGRNFEIAQGQILYVNSELLSKSSLASNQTAQAGFLIKKAYHESSQMVVEIEVLKKEEGSFKALESFKLVRPLSASSQDTSLSIIKRMQVKWYGPDEFLMEHASESEQWKATQRLEFGSGNRIETIILLPGFALVKQKQSMVAQVMGSLTQGMPIWVVEDVEAGGLRFRAWSVSGLYSEAVVLPRQSEQWAAKALQDQISLSAVRSGAQISIRIQDQRWNLQLYDWLLHTQTGWMKLTQPKQIDDYVEGKLVGELLILRNLIHEAEGWRADFRLYSPIRSQKHDFSLRQQDIPSSNIDTSPPAIINSEAPQIPTEDYFVPLQKDPDQEEKWDPNDVRAWEPPTNITPHAMQEILKSISEKQAD